MAACWDGRLGISKQRRQAWAACLPVGPPAALATAERELFRAQAAALGHVHLQGRQEGGGTSIALQNGFPSHRAASCICLGRAMRVKSERRRRSAESRRWSVAHLRTAARGAARSAGRGAAAGTRQGSCRASSTARARDWVERCGGKVSRHECHLHALRQRKRAILGSTPGNRENADPDWFE